MKDPMPPARYRGNAKAGEVLTPRLLSCMTEMATLCLEETPRGTAEMTELQHEDRELMHLVLDCCQLPSRCKPPKRSQASPEGVQKC